MRESLSRTVPFGNPFPRTTVFDFLPSDRIWTDAGRPQEGIPARNGCKTRILAPADVPWQCRPRNRVGGNAALYDATAIETLLALRSSFVPHGQVRRGGGFAMKKPRREKRPRNTRIKLIYSDVRRLHAPDRELVRDGMIPHPDTPLRGAIILKDLRQGGFSDDVSPGECAIDPILVVHVGSTIDSSRSGKSGLKR